MGLKSSYIDNEYVSTLKWLGFPSHTYLHIINISVSLKHIGDWVCCPSSVSLGTGCV
jgi:hypothetical protein